MKRREGRKVVMTSATRDMGGGGGASVPMVDGSVQSRERYKSGVDCFGLRLEALERPMLQFAEFDRGACMKLQHQHQRPQHPRVWEAER